ncbi:unnamed protein product [Alopecurus aequalis]
MVTQATVLAFLLLAMSSVVLCQSAEASASPVFIAGKHVIGGMELRRPMIDTMMTANQSAAEQFPTAASDGIGHRLHLNWFSFLSEVTSPMARDHPFLEQGIVLDHLLVFLVACVVYIFR